LSILNNYKDIAGEKAIQDIRIVGEKLNGKKVIHINSTKVGGGVAEILQRLIPLMKDAGIDAEWKTIEGNTEFYKVTKKIHNALHGVIVPINQEMFESYINTNRDNANQLDLDDADFVIIHDPQPAALIKYFPNRKGKWIWRCHIDLTTPDARIWEYLRTFVSEYDAAVFHIEQFAKRELPIKKFIIPPSIDPLSDKNRDLTDDQIETVLKNYSIEDQKPIITQIGRFDTLKDPQGVVKMHQLLRSQKFFVEIYHLLKNARPLRNGLKPNEKQSGNPEIDCQLILAGGLAHDDPEGLQVCQDLQKSIGKNRDVHILCKEHFSDLEINALQRASKIILQKSWKEGFGLTVSEALWKSKPVIGGNTGGIPQQIIDGENGFLVNTVQEAARKTKYLLRNPEKAEEMGIKGKEHVRKNFIITKQVMNHLLLYLTLETIPGKLVQI
jgi:trehalose synthase